MIPPISDLKPTGTLPVLYINVYTDATHTELQNEIIDKDLSHKNYFSDATYHLDVNGCQWLIDLGATSVGSEDAPLPLEIKARGNFTRKGYSKKPFKLKLGAKQNLLNINAQGQKSKHWAILAHADDEFGYMRNFVGFRLGEMIGLPWTPRQQPIEVVINGDYRGIYFLTESIRVGEGRVPITELDDMATDPALLSGGYLVELDNYIDDCTFSMPDGSNKSGDPQYGSLMVTADTPELLSDGQLKFLKEQFTKMNDCVNSNDDNELWSYLDLDDAARYYVVEEILSHFEAYHGSTYLFRERGEGNKWHFSPLWDCGHAFDGPTDQFFPDMSTHNGHTSYGNNWIGNRADKGLRGKSKFQDKVSKTFQWFVNKDVDGSASPYERLLIEIDDYVSHIEEAAKQDANRWKGVDLPIQVGNDVPRDVIDNSDIIDDKAKVKSHLDKKISWLKGKWGSEKLAEPERDTTPAAPLPDYVKEGYVPKTSTIYVIDDANWGAVNLWLYQGNNNYSTKWPGEALVKDETLIVDGTQGVYTFAVPESYMEGNVIFSNGGGTTQYPASGQSGLDVKDNHVFRTGDTSWKATESVARVTDWSQKLPLIRITTPNGEQIGYGDDGAVKNCSFELDALGLEGVIGISSAQAGALTIKGRGKSSWDTFEKKSYKLKLKNKTSILGMPKSAHWVLMPYANDAANGLLTNYAGHELSRLIGLEWTPSMQPVEVVIDGDYKGLYFIAENVRAAADRVQIADYGDTDPTKRIYSEADDFLLEFSADHADDGTELFYSWQSADGYVNKFITTTPSLEDINKDTANNPAEVKARIEGYLDGHVTALREAVAQAKAHPFSDAWTEVIDPEQAAKYYVVQEIMDDASSFTDNFYMHHTTGSKWLLGPVWDFGNAFSQSGAKDHLIHEANGYGGSFIKDLYSNCEFVWYVGYTYVKFITGENPRNQQLNARAISKAAARADAPKHDAYDPAMNGKYSDVHASIEAMMTKIEDAVVKDAVRWPELAATSNEPGQSLANRIETLKTKLTQSQEYLSTPTAEEGAGWNWTDITTGVEDVINGADATAEKEYYDVMGRRVTTPVKGNIYIVRRGTKVTKEVSL